MVVPLLGILGAGLASQAGAAYARDRYSRHQGNRLGGLLGELPEDATTDQKMEALATGGLLSADQYARYGSGDADSRRDFLEALAGQNNQYDLADRNNANSDRRGLDMLPQELGIREQFDINSENRTEDRDMRKHDRDRLAGLEETAGAIEAGLGTELQPMRDIQRRQQEVLQLADRLYKGGEARGWSSDYWSDPDTLATRGALKSLEDGLYYDYQRKTRGLATEAGEKERGDIREGFMTFTAPSGSDSWLESTLGIGVPNTDNASGVFNAGSRYEAIRSAYLKRMQDNSDAMSAAQKASLQKLNRLYAEQGQELPYPDVGLGTNSLESDTGGKIDPSLYKWE